MEPQLRVGPYEIFDAIGSGGMADVHLGRLRRAGGFGRVVAVKRLHRAFAGDAEFAAMLADEARLTARVRHPNVAATLDVAEHAGELLVVMEYVHGESLSRLLRSAAERREGVPVAVACSIAAGVLHGLHAAHEGKDDAGRPLELVHRDVSPQNVLVGADGVARVIDFGVAKAAGRAQPATRDGLLKGKLAYMAPEQTRGVVDRRADVYAAAVVLWELLTGRRLFVGDSESSVLSQVIAGAVASPREVDPALSAEISDVAMRGLAVEPEGRFATAREMALAVERCGVAAASEVGAWVEGLARETLDTRTHAISEVESVRTTMSAAAPLPRTGGRRRWLPAAITVGSVVLVLAAARVLYEPHAAARAPKSASAPASASASVSVSESTSASAAESTSASAAESARASPAAVAPRAGPHPSRPSCDPPYRIDAQGVHRYKPECLVPR